MTLTVVPLTVTYADEVLAIHQAGIDEGNATFETTAPTWAAFDAAKLHGHRCATLDADGKLLGWVAASRVSDRTAYVGVVEYSVCVHPGARGRRVAGQLLAALVESTDAAGIWTIQSRIFPENAAGLRPRAGGLPATTVARRRPAGTPQPSDHLSTRDSGPLSHRSPRP